MSLNTSEEIAEAVRQFGFPEYAPCFVTHKIIGEVVPYLTQENLAEIGIDKVGPRIQIHNFLLGNPPPTRRSHVSLQPSTNLSSKSPKVEDDYYDDPPPSAKSNRSSNNTSQTPSKSSPPVEDDYYDDPPPSAKSNRSSKSIPQTPSKSSPPIEADYDDRSSASSSTRPTKILHPPTPKPSKDLTNVSSANAKKKAEHYKMVASLKAARKYTKYEKDLAAGKAVGPPPELPPIEEPVGLIPCPYCGRKFGETAAAHHIPVCQRMKGGTPKSRQSTRK